MTTSRRARLLLTAAAGVLTTATLTSRAAAQATSPSAPTASATGREVSEVIVTAAPFAVSAESLTSHVDVVTRQQLDTAAPSGLGDLLNGLPGVRSSAYSPGASRPIIRGASGPRVLVLQNGIGQIDVSDVSPDHAVASDPAEASRIEILRGPSTLLYGGSGIGGVVNVIDDRVASARVDGVHGRFGASGGTVDGSYNVGGAARVGVGGWVVSVVGDHRESDDYDIPVPALSKRLQESAGVTSEGDRTLRNTFTESSTLGAGVSYVGDWGFLGASVRRLESRYGVPYAQIVGEPAGGDEGPVFLDLGQTRVDVRGELNLPGEGLFTKARLSGGWADYTHREISLNSGAVNTQFDSTGGEGRFELVQRDRGAWQGAIGVNGLARSFAALGDEAFVPPTDISRVGVFTLQRFDKERWGIEGGVRFDHAELSTTADARFPLLSAALGGSAGRREFDTVSGSIAGFLRPAPGWFLSVNYAHNVRSPTEVELFADGPHGGTNAFEVGDPNLKPEAVDSVEGTVRFSRGRVRAEAHGYYAAYSDYIEERNTGLVDAGEGLPIYRFAQLNADFAGVELEAGYALLQSAARELWVEGGYDYVRASGDDGPLARIPPYALTGRLRYKDDRFEARLDLRHVGEQDRVSAFELPTDGYTTVGLFGAWKPLTDKNVRLYVDARNLTDEETREHASFLKDIAPGPGRNVRLGVAYTF